MKLYDKVKQILEDKPQARNSDHALIWLVWRDQGIIENPGSAAFRDILTLDSFMKATSPESITRARRKVQELHPHLQAVKPIADYRAKKAASKGTFVFREPLQEKML